MQVKIKVTLSNHMRLRQAPFGPFTLLNTHTCTMSKQFLSKKSGQSCKRSICSRASGSFHHECSHTTIQEIQKQAKKNNPPIAWTHSGACLQQVCIAFNCNTGSSNCDTQQQQNVKPILKCVKNTHAAMMDTQQAYPILQYESQKWVTTTQCKDCHDVPIFISRSNCISWSSNKS